MKWYIIVFLILRPVFAQDSEKSLDLSSAKDLNQANDTTIVDRVVCVIDQRPVLQSEIHHLKAVSTTLVSNIDVLQELRVNSPTTAIIVIILIQNITSGVGLYQPSQKEIELRYSEFLKQWNSTVDYRAFLFRSSLTEAKIRNQIALLVRAERYLNRAINMGPVSTAEDRIRFHQWQEQLLGKHNIRWVSQQDR